VEFIVDFGELFLETFMGFFRSINNNDIGIFDVFLVFYAM